ncbi:hypothetical protein MAH1_33560 [Sessilibacter sp. MAH1]
MVSESDIQNYAAAMGIEPWMEYKVNQAAKLCKVGEGQLRSARANQEIAYIAMGSRYSFLGIDLIKWKLNKRIESEIITSPKTERETGAVVGMTKRPSKESQLASARVILSKQNN